MNGEKRSLEGLNPNTTLLNFLRDLGLTGTKEGCAEGECGACAVAVVTRSAEADRGALTAINSCLALAVTFSGQDLFTVEGVAESCEAPLHPVQELMVKTGGSQCGYCTPGFVVSLFSEYYRADRDDYDAESISGNLCRCTGYRPIREAAQGMDAPTATDPMVGYLESANPRLDSVSAELEGQRFFRPASLEEALKVLNREPNAKVIAGGTDLVVVMNQDHRRHDVLVSLDGVSELQVISETEQAITIGAGVRLSELEKKYSDELPVFEDLFPLFSSRLIRNRATLGGNIVNASPIGDSPPVLLALDAEVVLVAASGERTVPLHEFFTGYRKTVLGQGELVKSVIIPKPVPDMMKFYKVSKRILDDISTVAAAFAIDIEDNRVTRARLAYGGVAATPKRAEAAEAALVGQPWTEATRDRATAALKAEFAPMTDHRGSAGYRSHMVVRLFEKFFFESGVSASIQLSVLP